MTTVRSTPRLATIARRGAPRVVWHLVMAALGLGVLIPLLWMVMTSLRSQASVFGGDFFPDQVVFDGYFRAWNDLMIWRNLINSVYITAVSIGLIVIVATLAGYAFAKIKFAGRAITFGLIVSALFIPAVSTLIPLYIELLQFGLLGNQIGLILVYAASGVPFSVFLMRTFFEAIPHEISEAARMDGASEWQTFWHLMLPMAAPGIATIAIFQMLGIWNELLFASAFVSDSSLQTLQPAARQLVGEFATDYPGLTATMTISIVPMLVVYVIFQKWFVRGLTAGAIKA